MFGLKRIVEELSAQGSYYDFGRDFFNFKRALDDVTGSLKTKYETIINKHLQGKRVSATASKGYKQVEKKYDFVVSRITINDYFDHFVVIAHDETDTKKPKEYFLNPRGKIQILPSAQKISSSSSQDVPLKEKSDNVHNIYSRENIVKDISPWIKKIIKDPRADPMEFVPVAGSLKIQDNKEISLFIIKIQKDVLKISLNKQKAEILLNRIRSTSDFQSSTYSLVDFQETEDEYILKIKKTKILIKN